MFDISWHFPHDVIKNAKQDFYGIQKNIRKAKCRRTSPEHAMPNEVWRILLGLYPRKPTNSGKCGKHDLGHGIGYEEGSIECIKFKQMFFTILCMIRKTGCAPLSWHLSKSFSLPKKNPDIVNIAMDALRNIHTLDPVGKSFYKHVLDRASPPVPLPNEFGYLKGRRRETAIKQQLIVSWRLHANKINHSTTSYDMRNAFGSVHFCMIRQIFQFLVAGEDYKLFNQRFENAATCVCSLEGNLVYRIGSGPLPGDKIAADIFRIVFHFAMKKWVSKEDCRLMVKCNTTGDMCNIGKSMYADDLMSKCIFSSAPSPENMKKTHDELDQELDELIEPLGLHQNHSKKETIVSFAGTDATTTCIGNLSNTILASPFLTACCILESG